MTSLVLNHDNSVSVSNGKTTVEIDYCNHKTISSNRKDIYNICNCIYRNANIIEGISKSDFLKLSKQFSKGDLYYNIRSKENEKKFFSFTDNLEIGLEHFNKELSFFTMLDNGIVRKETFVLETEPKEDNKLNYFLVKTVVRYA